MNQETMTINISGNLAEKILKMSQEAHSSINDIFLKSIILMEIAIKNKKNGNKLAIINKTGNKIDEILGI